MSWTLITDFGDSAVMLPAAATIALWLGAGGAWRAMAAWLLSFGLGAAAVVGTKIAFLGWGIGIAALNFTGISGHTMLATAVTLTAIHLLSMGAPRPLRLALMAAGLAGALAIGISRLALDAHSLSEVCSGLIIGGLVAGGFALASRRLAAPVLAPGLMLASLAIVCIAMHGHQAGAQGLIERVSLYLSGHGQAYTRAIYAGIA